ncbi:Folylpolyglutamate synthetase [Elasticomyces elasticus]|nr:Folylpolyglutamate synthetase [Elasticomyces elasticus]KAK3643649.1 Folylpolyglutamate synthetase [Elasticomyces elasticus]
MAGPRKRPRKLPYQKLDVGRKEIRLLVVKKAEFRSDDIYCELRRAFLEDRPVPSYYTVSYVWGDITTRTAIYLDGKRVEIGASAEQALRRFRTREGDVLLWIDAVCINQRDIVERSQQVAIMGDIYSSAGHNLIWLGDDSDGSFARAQVPLQAVLKDARLATSEYSDLQERLYNKQSGSFLFSPDPSTPLDIDNLEDIHGIYDKAWFTRLWTFQEVALPQSSTVYCGEVGTPLQRLLLAAAWLRYREAALPYRINKMRGLRRAAVMWDHFDRDNGQYPVARTLRPGMLGLFSALEGASAHDSKDFVFGLLGFRRRYPGIEHALVGISSDYTRSLGVILCDAMRAALMDEAKTYRGSRFFSHLSHRSGDLQPGNIPSWAPRWHIPWDQRLDAYPYRMLTAIGACGDRGLEILESHALSDITLSLGGLVVGRVRGTAPVWTENKLRSPSAILRRLDCFRLSMNEEDEQRRMSSLARTLVAGNIYPDVPLLPTAATDTFRALLDTLTRGKIPLYAPHAGHLAPGDPIRLAADYFWGMYHSCRNRRLFTMTDRRIGLGPQVMEPGDVVAVVYGSLRPIVLRPLLDEGHYQVCGEAHVDDIMDGQWLADQEAKGRKDEVFTLH